MDARFFPPGSPVGATVASSAFMAILDHVSGTNQSSTLTVQLNRTSHRVIIVKCSGVQSNEAVSHIMPAGMNGGQIIITMACQVFKPPSKIMHRGLSIIRTSMIRTLA